MSVINLSGKVGLVVGVANDQSIAYGCAKAFHDAGAELAVTYINEKAEKHVRPLAENLNASLIPQLDVTNDDELTATFDQIAQRWGRLDFVLHSIAFANRDDLHGPVLECSRAGFLQSMNISCHSFIRMANLAAPLMTQGGCLLTVSYEGARRVVTNYNMMGPVKAALEAVSRTLAFELAPKRIRVHTLSPGPILTRAASGIAEFDHLVQDAQERAPTRRLATIEEVGAAAAFLVSDAAAGLTGETINIDGGHHLV